MSLPPGVSNLDIDLDAGAIYECEKCGLICDSDAATWMEFEFHRCKEHLPEYLESQIPRWQRIERNYRLLVADLAEVTEKVAKRERLVA